MTKQREELSKDPMSPENIREHEPTAVKRDPRDQEIVEGEIQAFRKSWKEEKLVLILLKQDKSLEKAE